MKKTVKEKSLQNQSSSLEYYLSKWGWVLLIILPVIMYGKTLGFFITQLDDYIFIFEKEDFNSHISGILKAFSIGVFGEKDVYYRPLFRISFIFEKPFSTDTVTVYHFTNLLLHIVNLFILNSFLKQLKVSKVSALLLTIVFAIHPVLTMAVAWVPGRNDTMLTLFALLYFKDFLNYQATQKTKYIFWQLLWFSLAIFTKETAVLIPFITLCFYFLNPNSEKKSIKSLSSFVILIPIIIAWYFLRSQVLDETYLNRSFMQIIKDSFEKLPVFLVYLGKIFFPVNLSVFPSLNNATLIYGLISVLILAAIIFFTKKKNIGMMLIGLFWFMIFIVPFFLVPKEINEQVFEHRLYLPIIGILILLSQTFIFNGEINGKTSYIITTVLVISFFIISSNYINVFKDTLPFWQNAVASSPESSYAQKQLGVRLYEATQKEEALKHMEIAYRLNKKEKHVRYFIVRDDLLPKDSLVQAEKLLREELQINPTYTEVYFELSHIFFMKQMPDSCLKYLLISREKQPTDQIINNNLLLTYITLKNYQKAKEQIDYIRQVGLTVDQKAVLAVEAIPH